MDHLGATGNFPEGKICKDDEGEIRLAITAVKEKNVVLVEFGKPVKWLGLPKEEALGLADLLKKHAEKLDS